MQKRICTLTTAIGWFAVATTTPAQTPNPNQAAVDTLTKDVAAAVFASINQPKAQEIYAQLLNCGEGCDPQQVIRGVGGWDAVGAKMAELSVLKNTARFQRMSPAEANAAVRKQLAQFYAKYKADKNYGKPLNDSAQGRILAKIDALLPPAPETLAAAGQPSAGATPGSGTAVAEETDIDSSALRMSQLERQVKEEQQNRVWMMILSAIAGLIVGAGVVYLLLVRALNQEIERLKGENNRLSRGYDEAVRQNKPTNTPRPSQPQPDYKQKADAYDALRAELGADPMTAIRQLKQQAARPAAANTPIVRSGEPVIEPNVASEPLPTTVPAQPEVVSVPPPVSTPVSVQGEVFYFPPPDPNGQFDSALKTPSLSPESAYRFSVNADNSNLATFRFEAEPGRVARFLTYRNYMIEPACDSENSFSSTYTRIAMRRDGEAVLENGSWRVKTKALIRYE